MTCLFTNDLSLHRRDFGSQAFDTNQRSLSCLNLSHSMRVNELELVKTRESSGEGSVEEGRRVVDWDR